MTVSSKGCLFISDWIGSDKYRFRFRKRRAEALQIQRERVKEAEGRDEAKKRTALKKPQPVSVGADPDVVEVSANEENDEVLRLAGFDENEILESICECLEVEEPPDDDEDPSDIVPDVDTKDFSALTLLDLFFEG